ncbi:hypothetical protein L6R52_36865 [Myxococcota bacterium]|nr:hypothetical protein [Myxococcota bacterium]
MSAIEPAPLDDADVERLIRLGAPGCVDEASIDHAELLAHAQDRASPEAEARVRRHVLACVYCGALEAEYRRIHEAELRRRRFRLFALAATVLVAVLAGLLLRGVTRSGELREYAVARVRGQVAAVMARTEGDVSQPWRFVADSPIEILLRPVEETSTAETPVTRVFVVEAGRLVARPNVRPLVEGDPGYPVLRIRAMGRELFGDAAAKTQLVIAYGDDDAQLATLDGRTLADAGRAAKLQIFDVDYRADGAR